MAVALSRERKHQNLSMIHSMRSQLVQETREERLANLAAIQRKRDQDQSELAQRSKEIRSHELSALKRRDVLKKAQEKELVKKAQESLALEFQKKVRAMCGNRPAHSSDSRTHVHSLDIASSCRRSSSSRWRRRRRS